MKGLGRRWQRDWLSAGLVATATGAISLTSAIFAADWPQYRGPEGLGVAVDEGLLRSWGEGQPKVVWRQPIGTGYSSISVVGERLWTMAATTTDAGEEEAVLCLDKATGETLWRVVVDQPSPPTLADSGPRSTPTIDGDVLYAITSRSRLLAMAAADGRILWSKELQAWGRVPRFGYSTSPLVDGDSVIVEVGRPRQEPGAVAFDKRSGEVRWSALKGGSGYSTPLAVEIDGVRQYVFFRRVGVQALSTAGERLWRHDTRPVGGVAMPLFLPPDRIFVAAADDQFGGLMLRVGRTDGVFHSEELWQADWMRNHFNSSVQVDGYLYGFDNATLRCLDGATGERRWAKRGFGKGSLVAAGDLLYVLSDSGTLALVRASPEAYDELGRTQATEGRAWTEPSLADGRLYVRDGDELVSLDVRGGDVETPVAAGFAEVAP